MRKIIKMALCLMCIMLLNSNIVLPTKALETDLVETTSGRFNIEHKTYTYDDFQTVYDIPQYRINSLCPDGFNWLDNGIPAEAVIITNESKKQLKINEKVVSDTGIGVMDYGHYFRKFEVKLSTGKTVYFWANVDDLGDLIYYEVIKTTKIEASNFSIYKEDVGFNVLLSYYTLDTGDRRVAEIERTIENSWGEYPMDWLFTAVDIPYQVGDIIPVEVDEVDFTWKYTNGDEVKYVTVTVNLRDGDVGGDTRNLYFLGQATTAQFIENRRHTYFQANGKTYYFTPYITLQRNSKSDNWITYYRIEFSSFEEEMAFYDDWTLQSISTTGLTFPEMADFAIVDGTDAQIILEYKHKNHEYNNKLILNIHDIDPVEEDKYKTYTYDDFQTVYDIPQYRINSLCPDGFNWLDNGIPAEAVIITDASKKQLRINEEVVSDTGIGVMDYGYYFRKFQVKLSSGKTVYFWANTNDLNDLIYK